MATHGEIKVTRFSYNGELKSSFIHAFHDGYNHNMIRDIFLIPQFIFNFLKSDTRNSYIIEMFTRDKTRYTNFDNLLRSWNSLIPISSIEHRFESFMVAFDPLMYEVETNLRDIDHRFSGIKIDFDKSGEEYSRLPGCVIKLDDVDIEEDDIEDFDGYIDNLNKLIYLEENKAKKIGKLTYHMNINNIVADLVWQEVNPSVKRDKTISEILS